ncbi:nose resistant to fluoxetine protein 6-like [Photinus pyralis]|uniref:nose resistant to fluoxetine protein 6-like n=1 Tax=Photinus pyralis TaxID=7054 RepID=UPI00126752D2|nr:nose resistant to fluoxetine protein 6-like [Photinus pyralis]
MPCVRLTPSFATILLFYVCLLKYFNTGPIWPDLIQETTKMCKQSWWQNLLYIQNYDDLFNLCIPEAWYLAVDMQLFLIAPVLLLGLRKWPRIALLALTALILLSIASCSITSWVFDIQRTGVYPSPAMKFYYTATHARASPWLLGFILGYIMSKYSKEKGPPNIDYRAALITWMLALVVFGVCVFVGSDENFASHERINNLFYNSFRRPAWALAMCWVIFSCHFGFGGNVT